MTHRIVQAFALATLLLAGAFAHADIWGWKDADGKWHYTDMPREGATLIRGSARGTSGQATASSAPSAATTTATQGAAIAQRLESESAARAVAADLAKKRAEQCKEATERYDSMIASRRLFREKAKGERAYLSDAELSQARIDARKQRDSACGAQGR